MSTAPSAGQDCPVTVALKVPPQGELRTNRAVAFSVTVRNPGGSPLRCQLPSTQVVDVLVERDGRAVWRWSQGMRFAAVLTPLSLPAGGAKSYRLDWQPSQGSLRDLAGQAIEPGSYQAVAVLKATPEVHSQTVSLRFLPPDER